MVGWRLVKAGLSARAFSGEGARLHGGRWSSPGTSVVYISETLSLAALYVLVHVQSSGLLTSYVTFRVEFDPLVQHRRSGQSAFGLAHITGAYRSSGFGVARAATRPRLATFIPTNSPAACQPWKD